MSHVSDLGGRFGNHYFRHMLLHLFASKFNLEASYACTTYSHIFEELGLRFFSGERKFEHTVTVPEGDETLLNSDDISFNVALQHYYQTPTLSYLMWKEIRENLSDAIETANPYRERYNNNNDLFMHIRLDDIKTYGPFIDYYMDALEAVPSFDKVYVSSDTIDHDICKAIFEKYGERAEAFINTEARTLQFASTCKHLILSAGSFSALLGHLALYTETVLYPNRNTRIKTMWYGDMHSKIESWKAI